MPMACDYIIPMSQESLGDTDIESLTSEFGENVDFNTVELDGASGMFRRAVNAADVARHKVQRALLTNKHDPKRNHGVNNAKLKRDNEHLHKHDKRQLKHEELTERMNSRSQRREADKERAEKLLDIKNRRDDRNDERKYKKDEERNEIYHNGYHSSQVHDNTHNRSYSVPYSNRSHDSHHTNNTHYHVNQGHNDNGMYPNTNGNKSKQENTPRPTAPDSHHASMNGREPAHNPHFSKGHEEESSENSFDRLDHRNDKERSEYVDDMNAAETNDAPDRPYGKMGFPTEAGQDVQGNVYIV